MESPAMLAQWSAVDEYFGSSQIPPDPVLEAAIESSHRAGLPPHNVAPNQGKLLSMIATIQGAKRILEIGTLGAYSTIWLARAVPSDGGKVITLEVNEKCVEVAKRNVANAGLEDRIEIIHGKAEESLARLVAENRGPFDLIFIDADKGTIIIADNVVRHGAVTDVSSTDPSVKGVREFTAALASDKRLTATTLQTVGSKGWDGFTLAVVQQL